MTHGIKLAGTCALFVLMLAVAGSASAEQLLGRVVGVSDGDTLTLLVENHKQYKVRLTGIDAPEKRQPFGTRAKEKLSDLTFQREVRVEWDKTDRYGRVLGKVFVSGRDANLQMIASGLAWHYKKYANEQSRTDRELYDAAETRARGVRIGLWQDRNPIPPWEFRRRK